MSKKHSYRAVIVIFILGIFISVAVFLRIQAWEQQKRNEELRFRAESRINALKQSYEQTFEYAEELAALARNEFVVESNDFLTQREFDTFTSLSFLKKGSLRGVAWLPQVSHSAFPYFQPQGQTFPHRHSAKQIQQSEHVHYPPFIKRLKPDSVLLTTSDFSVAPKYQEEMDLARDQGAPQMHLHIREGLSRILVFVPIYDVIETPVDVEDRRNALLGFILSEWDISMLFEETIAELPTNAMDATIESLGLKAEREKAVLLLYHPSRSRTAKDEGIHTGLKWAQDIPMGGDRWRITYEAAPAFLALHSAMISLQSLFLGLLITLGLSVYFWFAARQTYAIKKEVQKRTLELSEKHSYLEKTLEELQVSETRFRELVDQSPFSIQIFDLTGKTDCVNPAWETLWGQSSDLLKNYNILQDKQLIQKGLVPLIQQAFEGEVVKLPTIDYHVKSTGSKDVPSKTIKKWVRSYIYPVKTHKGSIYEVILIQEDVTLQHESFAKVRQMAVVLESIAESIAVTDFEGRILYVNPAFELITGYASEEAVGKTPRLLRSGEHPREYYELMWQQITQGEVWKGSYINRHKNGSLYTVEQSITPFYNEAAEIEGFIAVQRDVTQEREQQERTEHAQRLESLGVLAGGIAHDFNNLLAVIMGYTSMAISVLGKSHPMTEHLEKVVISSRSAGDLCNQMLAYSGQGNYLIEEFSLNAMIEEIMDLLSVSISKQVELYIEPVDVSCFVKGDASQIKQVVMNCIINGSEAIEECNREGVVAVSVYPTNMEESDFQGCFYDNEKPPCTGKYVCLRVQDNGCGMSEETLVKLFDPFFTTKFTGRGLGTSAILGIVRSHEGAIRVESVLREGSCFEVYFPCSKSIKKEAGSDISANKTNVIQEEFSEKELGNQMILIVDDELSIRVLCTQMLESFGHDVIAAADAKEGIEMFQKYQNQIHLILLDLSMPGMDGILCAQEMLKINSNAQIVLSSGYTEDEIKERLEGINLKGFLKKPYSMDHVQELLDTVL